MARGIRLHSTNLSCVELGLPPSAPLQDWREDDTLVLMLGDAGSGRSTFINFALGSNAAPIARGMDFETKSISHFITSRPTHPKDRYILVDTPGFDAGLWEDYQVLRRLVKWLKQSLPSDGRRRVAIVYLVEVDLPIPREGKRRMSPRKLSVKGIAEHTVVATTKWRNLGGCRATTGSRAFQLLWT